MEEAASGCTRLDARVWNGRRGRRRDARWAAALAAFWWLRPAGGRHVARGRIQRAQEALRVEEYMRRLMKIVRVCRARIMC